MKDERNKKRERDEIGLGEQMDECEKKIKDGKIVRKNEEEKEVKMWGWNNKIKQLNGRQEREKGNWIYEKSCE